jgi:hypothetical protein
MFKAIVNTLSNTISLVFNHTITNNTLDTIKKSEQMIETLISICDAEKQQLINDFKISIPEKFDFKYVKFTKKELDQFDKYLLKTRKNNKKQLIEKIKQEHQKEEQKEEQKENIMTDTDINELVTLFDNLSKRVCIDEYQLPTKKEIDILSIRNEVENLSINSRLYYDKEVTEFYLNINDTCEPFKCYENSEKTIKLLDYNELIRFIPSTILENITKQLIEIDEVIIVKLKNNEERKAVTGKIVHVLLYTTMTYDDPSLPKDDINIIKQMLLLYHKITYIIKKV